MCGITTGWKLKEKIMDRYFPENGGYMLLITSPIKGDSWVKYTDAMDRVTELQELTHNMQGEIVALKAGLCNQAVHIVRLREASKPFSNLACSDTGQCDCHNCKLRDAINETPARSLAKHDAEVIRKMLTNSDILVSDGVGLIDACDLEHDILKYALQLESSENKGK